MLPLFVCHLNTHTEVVLTTSNAAHVLFGPVNTLDPPRLPPELWGSGSRDGFQGEGHLPDQPDHHPENGPADMDSDTPPRGSAPNNRILGIFI